MHGKKYQVHTFLFIIAILPFGVTKRVMCLCWVQGQTNARQNGMLP